MSTLLKLQIGPVQDFIAQARSTRDLWSGSYLLSWLMANAISEVMRQCPASDFVFPDVTGQPLLRFLETRPHPTDTEEHVLTPNLPNLFLAVLPCDTGEAREVGKAAANVFDAVQGEWGRIVSACLAFLNVGNTVFDPGQIERWNFQIRRHWQVTWQIWPMQPIGSVLDGFAQHVPMLQGCRASSDGWNENYQLVSHRLDARRQTRDFLAWAGQAALHKDHFSGKEEAVANNEWITTACQDQSDRGLPFLLRASDALGAVNLIKRVWHKAYLERVKGLKRARMAFDSVPDVAAAPWRDILQERLRDTRTTFGLVRDFQNAVVEASGLLDPQLRGKVPSAGNGRADKWVNDVDPSVFNESTWTFQRDALVGQDRLRAEAVLTALAKMQRDLKLLPPGCYYAVIALDGDEMGKWVSGEKLGGPTTRELHRELSCKLSQFALMDARAIVQKHNGVLIFSGGDDVLALLPATQALECARELVAGFAQINISGKNLTASAGVAVGHVKAPLQDMVEAAQEAEKLAKKGGEWNACDWVVEKDIWDWPRALFPPAISGQRTVKPVPEMPGFGRDAIAATFYKRGGEMIRWGAKNGSAAWSLLEYFQLHSRPSFDKAATSPPISGRFAHRLAELLLRYGPACVNPRNKSILLKEVSFVISQQTRCGCHVSDEAALAELRTQLKTLCRAYLEELSVHRRPISEFLHLFISEAFVARQGD